MTVQTTARESRQGFQDDAKLAAETTRAKRLGEILGSHAGFSFDGSNIAIAERQCFVYGRTMREGPDIARIASLVGDPARANMLSALMDGGALTASELALEAGVGLPTASSHLSKLIDGRLADRHESGQASLLCLGRNRRSGDDRGDQRRRSRRRTAASTARPARRHHARGARSATIISPANMRWRCSKDCWREAC